VFVASLSQQAAVIRRALQREPIIISEETALHSRFQLYKGSLAVTEVLGYPMYELLLSI
jgi:hypothetical protein